MVKQEYKQGKHTIRIESAESLKDAELNGFQENEYTRYFVDDKKVDSYATLVSFITGNIVENSNEFIPNDNDLTKARNQMLQTQNNEMKEEIEKLKETYRKQGVNPEFLKNMDDMLKLSDSMIDKLDDRGLRVEK